MSHEIDPKRWREALGAFPTGVTVITTHTEDGLPRGAAVNAFCAVSLSPPLLLVCLDHGSRTLEAIRRAGSFCVNILAEHQSEIARRFADKAEPNRFESAPWTASPAGNPVLDGCVAWLDCSVYAIHDGGDHDIVVGYAGLLGADTDAVPLVYHRGRLSPFPRPEAPTEAAAE